MLCKHQYFVPFFVCFSIRITGGFIFFCMFLWSYYNLSIHQLIDIWSFPVSGYYSCYEDLHGGLCVNMFLLLLSKYLEVDFLGQITSSVSISLIHS